MSDITANLLSFSLPELESLILSMGEKKFRAKQIFGWLARGAASYDEMSNVPAGLRRKLSENRYYIGQPEVVTMQESKSDGTRKCLYEFRDGARVESVFMKYGYGNSICISTQVGCLMGCTFCASTMDGKQRDLTAGEMLGEVLKMKNVTDGRVLERRFNIGEKLEDVVIERRPYQYLYEDQSGRIFMNQETFEQIPIDNELVIGHEYMKESDIVEVVSDTTDGTILYAEMPVKTVLRVTHSEPGIKGDTATNTLKPATLETGVEVRVPLFINEGDLIQVDTRDGSYLQRVKE